VSVEFTPTMMVREPHGALTDHPVLDRLPPPFNSVYGDQHCRRHIAYQDDDETPAFEAMRE
jgi:hypothetical protein